MTLIEQLRTQKLTSFRIFLLLPAFLIFTSNGIFFDKIAEIYPWSMTNVIFLISLYIFHYGFILLLMLIFSFILPTRLVASLFLILTASVSYYTNTMGVLIDVDMVSNMFQTNFNEATDLLNLGFISHVLILGVLPTVLIWIIPFQKMTIVNILKQKVLLTISATAIMTLSIFSASSHFASFFREHKSARYYMHPTSSIYAIGKYVKRQIIASQPHTFISIAKRSDINESYKHNELVILIVGETARADHFSLNGYSRNTNPRLSTEERLISYSDISSCGTATAISVPCMFSYSDRKSFDKNSADYTENALDILSKAGVSILWRDNNSDSKGVANRIAYQDYQSPSVNPDCDTECRDTGMLDGLQDYIDSQPGDILIILHSMGSHGPAYYKRYPKEFERFKPACKTLELSQCSDEEITNAYDNTILYTDYFVSRAIELLKQNTPKYETTLFYISDHGESLGESGVYLHGMPYFLAPEQQTKVPIIAWVGSSSDIDFEKSLTLKDVSNSHDAVFSTLNALFEVETDLHNTNAKPLVYFDSE